MTVPASFELPAGDADVDIVARMLQGTLDAIVSTFNLARIELPARRYITFGATAVDCEQLTVQLDQLYAGEPGGDPNAVQQCNGPRTCAMTVQLWRCTPSNSGSRGTAAPTPLDLSNSALASSRDAWLLLDSVAIVSAEVGWNTGAIAEVSALEAQGTYKGLSMSLVVPVP